MMRTGFALVLACALVGCIRSSLVECGDGLVCPAGAVCAPLGGSCVDPEQIDACLGKVDGADCSLSGAGNGLCQDQVCVIAVCGDGVLDLGEACDDGNTIGGDGMCNADCSKFEVCGDGFVDEGEACDDANTNSADACDLCQQQVWVPKAIVSATTVATKLGLAHPRRLAFDGQGRIYVADAEANRIRRIDPSTNPPTITTVAGIAGDGGFSGDGGPATSAQLHLPSDVAVDGLGRLFIADTLNHRIRRVDQLGSITTIAGTGTAGFNNDGLAIVSQLNNPEGIAIDGLGRVFVADTTNQRVRRIDTNGVMTTIMGTGSIGNGPADQNGIGTALHTPRDVDVRGSRICVADADNSCVRCVDTSGGLVSIAAGQCNQSGFDGDTIDKLNSPSSVAIVDSTTLLVADSFNHKIRRVDANGISTIANQGNPATSGFAGDGDPATGASLFQPQGIAVRSDGLIVLADSFNSRIRAIDSNGIISTVGGDGSFQSVGDGGFASAALVAQLGFARGLGMAVGPDGEVLVGDADHHRVRRIDADGTISTIAGTGEAGTPVADVGKALETRLNAPEIVAVDTLNNVLQLVYVADTVTNTVYSIDPDGVITRVAGGGLDSATDPITDPKDAKLTAIAGLAVDSSHRLYISENLISRVRRIETTGMLQTFLTSTEVRRPRGLAMDANDQLYVADSQNKRIVRFDTATTPATVATLIAGGPPQSTADDIPADQALLTSPDDVAVDANFDVYVTDRSEARVRKISGGMITTIAGTLQSTGNTGDGGLGSAALLNSPTRIAVDATGVLIADNNNLRIRRFDKAAKVITGFAGIEDPEGVGPAKNARLADPRAIALGADLTFVASGSSRVVELVRTSTPSIVEVVGGRYPQVVATSNLFRYRSQSFGTVGGVAFDPTGDRLFVTETSGRRIHVVDRQTGMVSTLVNAAGSEGFGDSGAGVQTPLREPTGMFFGGTELLFADRGNHVIQSVRLADGAVSTVAGVGETLGFFGDGGLAKDALLNGPQAVTRCPNGDVFIADTDNNRIRRIDMDLHISTVLGDGSRSSSGAGAPAHDFPVNHPLGVACDAAGNLYISSTNAIRQLPSDEDGFVDGTGPVLTIYVSQETTCITGVAVVSDTTLRFADSCTGQLVDLIRQPVP